jgi:hypothetical protein
MMYRCLPQGDQALIDHGQSYEEAYHVAIFKYDDIKVSIYSESLITDFIISICT